METRKIKFSIILLIIPIVLFFNMHALCSSNPSAKDDDQSNVLQEKSFDTTPGKTFHLETSFGDVVITTSDNPKVIIKIKGNENSYKKLIISYENTDNGISVIAKKKGSWNIFNFWGNNHLTFDITLPKTYNADVSTSGGDMSIKDLKGEVVLNTSGGDVKLADIIGPAKVKTSGGDISLNNISGAASLRTSGGDIEAKSFTGGLGASTSGGDITLSGSDSEIKASTSGGDIQLNYSGQNKGIELSSSGGNIEVKVPADFKADARLSSSGGSIDCKFKMNEVQEMSSHKMIGKFNNGGERLVVKTSGGEIVVR